MKSISQLTVMVIDRGLFSDLAVRIDRDVKKVFYHIPNDSDPFPLPNSSMVGSGLNLEVTEDIFGNHFQDIDLFVFPDVGFSALQNFLTHELGKKVWGCHDGALLETDRGFCKEMQKKAKLPVGPYEIIKGLSQLRSYLKGHEDVYVKINQWRGVGESFRSKDYKTSEPKLDELTYKLGPLKESIIFCVEQPLPDRVEIGSDSYCIQGECPGHHLVAIEIKDGCLGGCIMNHDDIPHQILSVDQGMKEGMASLGYQGFYSTEVRANEKDGYLIDFTARGSNPGCLLESELYKNFTEILWAGAHGECIDPEYDHTWGVQLMMKSDWANQEKWQPIDFPQIERRWIKISNGCKIGDQYYSVPLRMGLCEVGSVLGVGDSLDEAIEMCKDKAKLVSGFGIDCETDCLDELEVQLDEAKRMGLNLSP